MKKRFFILSLLVGSQCAVFADAPYRGTSYLEFSGAATAVYSYLDYAGTPEHVFSVGGYFFGRLIFSGGFGFGLIYGGDVALVDSLGVLGPTPLIMDAGIGPCFAFRFISDTSSFTMMPAVHFNYSNDYPLFGAEVVAEVVILVSMLGGIHLGVASAFDFIPVSGYVSTTIPYTFSLHARLYLGLTMFFQLTGPTPPKEEIRYHIPEENRSPSD